MSGAMRTKSLGQYPMKLALCAGGKARRQTALADMGIITNDFNDDRSTP